MLFQNEAFFEYANNATYKQNFWERCVFAAVYLITMESVYFQQAKTIEVDLTQPRTQRVSA